MSDPVRRRCFVCGRPWKDGPKWWCRYPDGPRFARPICTRCFAASPGTGLGPAPGNASLSVSDSEARLFMKLVAHAIAPEARIGGPK